MSEEILSQDSKKELLAIARESAEGVLAHDHRPPRENKNPQLQPPMGCFVTYKNHGDLRGCIGCFESDKPLHQTVHEYAAISATQDFRFASNMLSLAEMPEVTIEISVLTPMKKISDPRKDIELGRHGIYIKKGMRGGTYLPQVATEHNMSFEEFLGTCCAHKAGLPFDAWETDPEVEVFTYEAIVFSEEDFN